MTVAGRSASCETEGCGVAACRQLVAFRVLVIVISAVEEATDTAGIQCSLSRQDLGHSAGRVHGRRAREEAVEIACSLSAAFRTAHGLATVGVVGGKLQSAVTVGFAGLAAPVTGLVVASGVGI